MTYRNDELSKKLQEFLVISSLSNPNMQYRIKSESRVFKRGTEVPPPYLLPIEGYLHYKDIM